MSGAPSNELRYQGIVFRAEGIHEERRGRSVVALEREDVRRIEVHRGPPGERLWLQAAFAVVLVVIGVVATAALLGEIRSPVARVHVDFAGGAGFIPLGGFVLWLALRPRYYLRITTTKETRKLAFETRAKANELSSFLHAVERVHGYDVTWRLSAPPTPASPFR